MNEAEVLLKTHQFLNSQGLSQQPVVRLYADAHSSLLPYKELAPFQRFTLDMGDFVMHPDLVGQLGDGETIFAVEAKGDSDLIKGLAQAEMYQVGFHLSFLAADATALGTSLVDFARRKNIGVIAVSDRVKMAYLPEALMPRREAFKFIYRQMESVVQVAKAQTFQYNIPTHYLVWSIVLKPNVSYHKATLPNLLIDYPMPKHWQYALAGAQKLGLVSILGDEVQLTAVGSTVQVLLPKKVDEWAQVHEQVGARGRGMALVECQPQAAAGLRLLLLQEPMVRLVIDGLQRFPNFSANFAELAVVCDRLDHARAPVFFLKPESAALLTDERGQTDWERARGEDYRSRMFHQYKSILKHAGILKNTKLGSPTAKECDPTQDIWELK